MPEPKFEKDLEKLEKIVDTLEEGGLPLDDSIKKFEEGIKLAKRCEKALSSAEKKIEVLTKNAQGKIETKPFADDEEEEDADEEDEADRDDDGELLF
ncbi:MAG: exodeoxyribonuclease VII small subunit [Candidatus Hydrogenedentes bacterium]|nr:exodeoxyribonuclease VII small subunit [Candidatus Hydrogenedentota bacterium]